MNQAHLHLLVNHFPIIGTYLSVIVLVAGLILKNQSVKYTGLVLLIIAALFSIPSNITGEGAEEVLEATGQANKDIIETHEEAAEWGLTVSLITGGIALLTFILAVRKMQVAKGLIVISTVAAIFSSFTWFKVGNSGGNIRHTEIRDGYVAPPGENGNGGNDHDD